MAIHWAAVLLAWLAGVAMQLQQADLARAPGWVLLWGCAPCLVWWFWPAAWGRWGRALHGVRRATGGPLGVGLISLAAMALGWSTTQWRAQSLALQVWPAQALAVHGSGGPHTVWLTGQVTEMAARQPWGWSVKVQVQQWAWSDQRRQGGQRWQWPGFSSSQMTPHVVSLRLDAHAPEPVPGEVWRWPVDMAPVQGVGQRNPGGFDLSLWLWEQGIRAVGQVDRGAAAPVLLRPVSPWSPGVIERWRMRWRERIVARVLDERAAGLIRGLTIGEQGAISMDDWDALRLTGTAHLAAISGLHITMMGGLVGALLGWCWRRSVTLIQWCPAPTVQRWATVLGALVYALLAGWGIPAQRTVWMLLVVAVLRSSGRRWPWPLVLLLAAVVVTALDPLALMSAGFWLSFVAVGVLMWGGADTLTVPGSTRWAAMRHAALELWRTQRLASLGLAPLSLVFFQSVSITGLGVNLLCIPWFTVVLTPLAMLGLVLDGAWSGLVPLMVGTLNALSWLASWPWSVWQVPAVAPWAAALAMVGGAWLLAPLSWRWRLLAVPLCLPLAWSTSWSQAMPRPESGEVDLVAADIGQGTAVLVRTARHNLLFDTGPPGRRGDDAGRKVLVGLMRSAGVHALDELMLSHGDADHTGGAASVLRALPVKSLRTGLRPGHELLSTRDLWGRLPHHEPCQAGQRWTWDGVQFNVLHPFEPVLQAQDPRHDNDMSCVLRVQAHGRRVLITGDIESGQEAALVEREGRQGLASEVLLVPHHGSKTSSTPAFLDAVQPSVAVVQVGARNAYGHPHPKVMARYRALAIPAITTPACGAWWWSSLGPRPERPAPTMCWRAHQPRYWQEPAPLAE